MLQRVLAIGGRPCVSQLSRQFIRRCGDRCRIQRCVPAAAAAAALGVAGVAGGPRPRCAAPADVLEEDEVLEEDLAEVRRVVKTISTNTRRDPDAWVARARAAFSAVARPDGTLRREEVVEVIERLMASGSDQSLPWELAPLLFRLLDADRDGGVTLKDFLLGQALLFAAARRGSMEQLSEVCWRSIDIAGDDVISKNELAVAVSLMLHLDAVDPDHLAEIKARLAAKHVRRMKSKNAPSPGNISLEAVAFYMDMYDPNSTGYIMREDFDKCSALQENFKRLLTNDKVNPIFLARAVPIQERPSAT